MLIQGSIISITPPDYTNQFGVQYQNITIQTVQGPVEGRIGTKKPYAAQDINQQGQWDCETASNTQGTYNKFKKHYDKPYQGQQAPSQPAQPTNYQPPAPQGKKEPDWDAKDLRMARMNALTNSTRLICLIAETNKEYTENPTDDPTLLKLITKSAEILVHYIYNGLTKKQAPEQPQTNANPDYVGNGQEGICPHCQKPLEDCTCDIKF